VTAVADRSFWLETFREHGSSVFAFLKSRVGRRELAEDLLQETFVRAMGQGDRLEQGGRIRAYLFTTAHHLVLDLARRKRPLLFSELARDDDEGGRSPAERPDPEAPGPDAQAELRLFEHQLGAALEALPPKHRVAFEAAVLRGRPYAEVAREQNCSLEQVKTHVFRARQRLIADLRRTLRPEAGDDHERL
jgi:RNA polymerase sigma-70 factor (ECF subfamily)